MLNENKKQNSTTSAILQLIAHVSSAILFKTTKEKFSLFWHHSQATLTVCYTLNYTAVHKIRTKSFKHSTL